MNWALNGAFLVAHGLVTVAIGAGSLANGPGVPNPTWLGWWPAPLGRSWLLDALPFASGGGAALGAALWMVAGAGLVTAGAGALGVPGLPGLQGSWQQLAGVGAGLSLAALALYLHPYYALGVLLNAAIAITLFGQNRAALPA